ncbi:MAG: zinc ABC transporter substrate-binding protein, partial [Spirochaetaceae bacterium]|nr:zinc ABC transporter substrate-binding protein [Spirochaetaceae bacterium]
PFFVDASLSAEESLHQLMHHDHHHEEEAEYDEHVWLSLRNAAAITQELSEAVQKLDSKNAALYKANAEFYIKQLSALDSEFEAVVAKAKTKTLVFADRFPFRYLVDDYGLKYFAAFAGCSAESEASFETVVFLAKKLDELGLSSVLTIEKSDKKIAKTVISATKAKNQQILEMDSLQSVTQKDIAAGKSYLDAMKQNLETLKAALK